MVDGMGYQIIHARCFEPGPMLVLRREKVVRGSACVGGLSCTRLALLGPWLSGAGVYWAFTLSSAVPMMDGGLGISRRRMCRLMKYGSHTVNSWPMNFFVGTEKT